VIDKRKILALLIVLGAIGAGVLVSDAAGASRRHSRVMEPLRRGWAMPTLVLTATDGREVNVSPQMRGKVVIVEFWSITCSPCTADMPKMKAMYERLHDKGLEIVGISGDKERDKMLAFVSERGIPWPQCLEDASYHSPSRRFGVRVWPTNVLVDRRGMVQATRLRGKDLEDAAAILLDDEPDATAAVGELIARVASQSHVTMTGTRVEDAQGNSIEIVGTEPNSPAVLKSMGQFHVKVRYQIATDRAVRIWAKPSTATKAYYSNPSKDSSKWDPEADTVDLWVAFKDEARAPELTVVMADAASRKPLLTLLYRCDARWK
jgi:peroxiredoxin